jgi:hypothetical protein
MATALKNDIPRRVGQLEDKHEGLKDHVHKIDTVIAEIRTDLRWMKWLLMVVVIEGLIVIVQSALT